MATYVFIDVSRKQQYIFKHNRLRDNLFNSYIIKAVTEEDKPQEHKLDNDTLAIQAVSLSVFLQEHFSAEKEPFVYSGGGNSIIKLSSPELAAEFSRKYSRAVLEAYPDLELYLSKVDESEVDLGKADYQMEIRRKLHERADQLKDKRRSAFRRWTYGIEEIGETGKAVPWTGQVEKPTEREEKQEDQARIDLARSKLFGRIEKRLPPSVEITVELKKYKLLAGEKSYIGIISVDGNKMGEMVSRMDDFARLNDFSETIEFLYADAVIRALQVFTDRMQYAENNKILLITPVVLSGDDICLITEGEAAIEVATQIVKELRKLSEQQECRTKLKMGPDDESYLTACAGVAIVKVNYPFFDAVKKAEALCHQAKESAHRLEQEGQAADSGEAAGVAASFIDWEIVQGQVMSESVYESQVRHRKDQEIFHIKPLRIDQEAAFEKDIYSYDAFKRLTDALQAARYSNEPTDRISSSFLEQIKKVLYGGWTQYSLLFRMNQRSDSRRLANLVKEIFLLETSDSSVGEREVETVSMQYGVVVSKKNSVNYYTYLLNDVLEVLDFMPEKEEERHDQRQ
ncbi:Cas10/Cmr2 second palm domain-containing protein [Paenibacillus monticola]|uniref:Cas10/Cmr2 second palm domain-containing protein n=1 Tax=Paenibacillus monticola TaxID=2666075 RepID=A0A7X2L185_9BACL|nr:hypothetical protein [Paenibacillus monticola]MRN53124.1 hypothetical protein [Paenibacillus monticola]